MTRARLTHLTTRGEAHMVDVGAKDVTLRVACATARVRMSEASLTALGAGTTPKGDVMATARIAGIQAAKRTSDLIPLCHTIALTRVTIDITIERGAVVVAATAEARDRTGVEMEAMVAASTAALTIYDMLKAIDRSMTIEIALEEKTGGKSGPFKRARKQDGPRRS